MAWPVAGNPADAASWLECNGQSTTGYPELAAVVGATVPDLRGRFLRGFGGNSAALGVAQGDAIRNMTGQGGLTIQNGYAGPITGVFKSDSRYYDATSATGTNWPGVGIAFDASRQVPTANENRPANIAVRYLIRARL